MIKTVDNNKLIHCFFISFNLVLEIIVAVHYSNIFSWKHQDLHNNVSPLQAFLTALCKGELFEKSEQLLCVYESSLVTFLGKENWLGMY